MPATTSRRKRASQIVLVATALLLSGFAWAQGDEPRDYPVRPLRIVVGFTPGGGPDITARHIAQRLGETFKQPVIVENKPGAGGTVAAALVARAPADGYTLLSVSSAHAAAAAIYPKLPYAAKAKPGTINFSSAGVGSGTHFAAEVFKAMAAIDVVHVPFKGIPDALGETVAGRVQFFMAPIANGVNLVRDGKLVGLGVSSKSRDALLPDVPTIDESGVPGYEQELWFGILGPAGIPRPVMAKLNTEIGRVLSDPDTQKRWSPIGIEPRPTTPQQFDQLIAAETALYTRIARAAKITSE